MISAGQLRDKAWVLESAKDDLGQRLAWTRTGKVVYLFRDNPFADEIITAGGTGTMRTETVSGRWLDVVQAGITESSRLEFEDGTVWRVEGIIDVGRKRRRAEIRIARVTR